MDFVQALEELEEEKRPERMKTLGAVTIKSKESIVKRVRFSLAGLSVSKAQMQLTVYFTVRIVNEAGEAVYSFQTGASPVYCHGPNICAADCPSVTSDLHLTLGLEVEAHSKPALYLKSLLTPEPNLFTTIPLQTLVTHGEYKEWVMLDSPKCGCVNVHMSTHKQKQGLSHRVSVPLIRSLSRSNSASPTPIQERQTVLQTELVLEAVSAASKPKEFRPFCQFAFFMGLKPSATGEIEKEKSVFIPACHHNVCLIINKNQASHEFQRLTGSLVPTYIYSEPQVPSYPTLPNLTFPLGLQICFNDQPPSDFHYAETLPDGNICYFFLFYAAVSALDLGHQRPMTVFVPTVFGLISEVRDFELMANISEFVIFSYILDRDSLTIKSSSVHEEVLKYLTQTLPAPNSYNCTVKFQLLSQVFQYYGRDRFHLPETIYRKPSIFSFISCEMLISAVVILALEKKLVVVAEEMARTAEVVSCLADLVYPLEWTNLLMPVLPNPMIELVTSPLPILIGVSESQFQHIRSFFPEISKEAAVLRCDVEELKTPSNDSADETLPKAVFTSLKSQLERDLEEGSDSTEKFMRVRETFGNMFAGLLANYRNFVIFTDGTPCLNKPAFLRTVPIAYRPFVSRLTDTNMFTHFLHTDSEPGKYWFHKMTRSPFPKRPSHYSPLYIIPPFLESVSSPSASGTYRDVLPSPRRLPTFNSNQDFCYSDSEDETDIAAISHSFQPIGSVPNPSKSDIIYYVLPLYEDSDIPEDFSSVFPGRINTFLTAEMSHREKTDSVCRILVGKIIGVSGKGLKGKCGELIRLIFTSKMESQDLKQIGMALRLGDVRKMFISCLAELHEGKPFPLQSRSFLYLSNLLQVTLLDCLPSGDYETAVGILTLSDFFYYPASPGLREYLIYEFSGYSLWSLSQFWSVFVELANRGNTAVFQIISKAAGYMSRLDVELSIGKEIIGRLGNDYHLDAESKDLLPVLVDQIFKARKRELAELESAEI